MTKQLFLLLLLLLTVGTQAHAAPASADFIVNSNLDVGDNNVGDGICYIGFGFELCSLRAAVEEANALNGMQSITFDLPAEAIIEIMGSPIDITQAIAITGQDNIPDELTETRIRTNGSEGIFRVDAPGQTVLLDHLLLSNGVFATEQGAAVRLLNGTLTLNNGVIQKFSSIGCGAAVHVAGGNLAVNNMQFEHNNAAADGGVLCSSGGDVQIADSVFLENSADSRGGALFVNGHDLSISGTHFSNNRASNGVGRGGAVFVLNGQLTLSDAVFDNNVAIEGGAVYLRQLTDRAAISALIEESEFVANSADLGGALYAQALPVTVVDSTFSDNSVSGQGGAIYHNGQPLTLTAANFVGNAAVQGGALYQLYGSLDLTDAILLGNNAFTGGAIYADAANLHLDTVAFNANSANGEAGGMMVTGGSAELSAVTFFANQAGGNGGGMVATNATLDASRVNWFGNDSEAFGGGLFTSATDGVLAEQLVNDNSAFRGGGMWLNGTTLIRSSFWDNSTNNAGGGLVMNGDVSVYNSSFGANSTKVGGGIYVVGGSDNLIRHATIAENAVGIAGGGISVAPDASLQIQNSIVAFNHPHNCNVGLNGHLLASSANLSDDASCIDFTLSNVDPAMVELSEGADIPGRAFPLLAGSPAIDAGNPVVCAAVGEVDQRNYGRDDGACDLGAFEFAGTPTAVTLANVTVHTARPWLLVALSILILFTRSYATIIRQSDH